MTSPNSSTMTQPTIGPGLTRPRPLRASSSARAMNSRSESVQTIGVSVRVDAVECTSASLVAKKTVHVLFRVEHDEIINLLSDARIANGQAEFLCDRHCNSAFCGAIEFC